MTWTKEDRIKYAKNKNPEARHRATVNWRKKNWLKLRLKNSGIKLTEAEYDEIYQAQFGRCAICKVEMAKRGRYQTCIDHDHTTKRVRGLLCPSCNMGLGKFKDDPELLLEAARYVKV